MRIVNVLVPVGPYAADIGRIWELRFVVVFVVPTPAPTRGVTFNELLPRSPVDLRQRGDAADVENRRGQINRENLLVDYQWPARRPLACASGLCDDRIPHDQRHANARL